MRGPGFRDPGADLDQRLTPNRWGGEVRGRIEGRMGRIPLIPV